MPNEQSQKLNYTGASSLPVFGALPSTGQMPDSTDRLAEAAAQLAQSLTFAASAYFEPSPERQRDRFAEIAFAAAMGQTPLALLNLREVAWNSYKAADYLMQAKRGELPLEPPKATQP